MSKIAIATDSTADIPPEICKQNNIYVMPLSIVHGDQIYQDGIDIKSEEFYDLLARTDTLPKSSQPSPQDFEQFYHELLQSYDKIISIHLSSGLSGTVNAAYQAGKNFPNRVDVFDSKSISVGIALQVLEAVEKIQKGWQVEAILGMLTSIRDNVETIFTLDTLEYLQKGGRIGKVSSMVGSFFNVKPIIRVEDGIYVPYGKTRSRGAALTKIASSLQKLAHGRSPKKVAIANGKGAESAQELKKLLVEQFDLDPIIDSSVGPVIGVHTGPGTVGAAVLYDEE